MGADLRCAPKCLIYLGCGVRLAGGKEVMEDGNRMAWGLLASAAAGGGSGEGVGARAWSMCGGACVCVRMRSWHWTVDGWVD